MRLPSYRCRNRPRLTPLQNARLSWSSEPKMRNVQSTEMELEDAIKTRHQDATRSARRKHGPHFVWSVLSAQKHNICALHSNFDMVHMSIFGSHVGSTTFDNPPSFSPLCHSTFIFPPPSSFLTLAISSFHHGFFLSGTLREFSREFAAPVSDVSILTDEKSWDQTASLPPP